jgi:hypothetical protein
MPLRQDEPEKEEQRMRTRARTALWALTLALVALLAAPLVATAAEEEKPPPPQVFIENVKVWDGTSSGLSGNTNVLIEGNPLEDITILSDPDNNLRLIMKDGVIYKNTLGGIR